MLPGVGLIGGVALASLNDSATGPVKSLQAVTVTLGPDGSTTKIGTTTLSETKGRTTTTTSVLDPRATSTKLPVRVAVSYVSGNKSGTDLRQFVGATGPVEMDVTVTNNTVHPEAFTANYAASNGSTYALVATPMTVVATATLPKASVLSVTTPATAVDTPHTTNGIIGQTATGDTTVQWTALLAPPRLAPSSTFRLVVDASKFALGGLNISVEPGLQTDPSVAHLVSTALGAGQVSQVDGQTVTLVTNIDSTLQETSRTLDALRSRLSKTAGSEGTNATQLLTNASGDLTQSSTTLTSDVNALKANVKNSLDEGRTGSESILNASVDKVIAYFGLPADGAGLPTAAPSDASTDHTSCKGSIALANMPAANLLAQLGQTAQALHQIAADGSGCEQAAVSSLDATIGDPTQGCTAAATSPQSLNCLLGATAASLSNASSQIANQDVTIEAGLDRDYATNTLTAIGALGADLDSVKVSASNVASAIGSSGTSLGTATKLLDGATTAIGNLSTDLLAVTAGSPGDDGAPGTVQAASAAAAASASASAAGSIAGQEAAQLSSASPSPGVSAGLGYLTSRLATTICAIPTLSAPSDGLLNPDPSASASASASAYLSSLQAQQQAYADELHKAVDGTVCKSDPAVTDSPTPLTSVIDSVTKANRAVSDNIASVQTSLDQLKQFLVNVVANLGAAQTAAGVASNNVASAAGPVKSIGTSQGGGLDVGGLQASANDVTASLEALSSAGPSPEAVPSGVPCPTATPSDGAPLNAIQAGAILTACNSQTVIGGLHGLIASVSPTLVAASAQVSAAAAGAQGVKAATDKQLAALLTGLTSEVNSAADAEYVTGASNFSTQRDKLNTSLTALVGTLDAASKSAVNDLDTNTGQAVASQDAATKALVTEVKDVLQDLGTGKDQSGLLGAVSDGAVQAGVGNDSVADASTTANNFGAVRAAEQDGIRLGNEVNDRSLAEVPTYQFGPAVPAGSTRTTVFNFQLAG